MTTNKPNLSLYLYTWSSYSYWSCNHVTLFSGTDLSLCSSSSSNSFKVWTRNGFEFGPTEPVTIKHLDLPGLFFTRVNFIEFGTAIKACLRNQLLVYNLELVYNNPIFLQNM